MKKRTSLNVLLSIFSLLICLIFSELVIRYFGSHNRDGNFSIGSRTLKPYHLPIVTTQRTIDEYLLASSKTFIMYDPFLGWSPRPNSRSSNDLYHYNSFGIRTASTSIDYSMSPSDDTLRIVIIGDSFTHGDEVPFENTWGYHLEKNLQEININTQVINLGVGGYGMDQAFLRWKQLGYKFSPHLVIFGLQMEDAKRNMNLIRPIYFPGTSLPFSKPRFILQDNELKLINSPTIPFEEILNVIENITTWDMVKYEHFFNPEDYHDKIWSRSKLVSLILEVTQSEPDPESSSYDISGELAKVALKIIQELERDVESHSGVLLVVHLPKSSDLADVLQNGVLEYSELLEKIKENHHLIDAQQKLLKEIKTSSLDTLFTPRVHYTAKGNEVIANTISNFIVESEHYMSLGLRN